MALIMITNDDGVRSRGIAALAEVARRYGEVVVVAPDKSNSGMSHAISVMEPLKVVPYEGIEGVKAYAVGGTPVDCVKLGVYGLLDHKPDLLLSGINHGTNTSVSAHYSGTLGAAREGGMMGIVSCGISQEDHAADADFSVSMRIADKVIGELLAGRLPKAGFYSLNVPKGDVSEVRWTSMEMGRWVEKPYKYTNPFGEDYYWLDGSFIGDGGHGDTDDALMRQGFATLTPLSLDATDREAFEKGKGLTINI